MRVSSDSLLPVCFLFHTRPANLASLSWEENLLISPIEAMIPAEYTGPMPLTEIRGFARLGLDGLIELF